MIFVVILSTVSVFILTWIIVYFSLINYNANQADGMTQIISAHNGVVPKLREFKEESSDGIMNQIIFSEESAFRTRYFVVTLNEEMQAQTAVLDHIASVDEETACAMADNAVSKDKTVGYINEYRFRIAKNNEDNTIAIFVDCSESFASLRITTILLAIISILLTLLVTFVFSLCSKQVMKPFEENSRKQKQFITDASHELKTPIAIISANAEVLEYKTGSSEWLSNITGQVSHMSELIDRMLTLSKMEEFNEELEIERIDFSGIINDILDSFGEVFRQKNVDLQTDIADDVSLDGNLKQLQMLISILVENTSKYVTEAGTVKVSLNRFGKHMIFRIYNTAVLPSDVNFKHLFDRFYRPDTSRSSSTGGQGIGLSIAKKIVTLHNGSISAERVDDGICFAVELPRHMKMKARM